MSLQEDIFGSGNLKDYKHLIKEAGKEIVSNYDDSIIQRNSGDYLLAVVSQADFSSSDDECLNVVHLVRKFMKSNKGSTLPYVLEHNGLDLASRCLCSLSFFYDAVYDRSVRHGAPSPSYYRTVGKNVLINHEMKGVSAHFERWEHFLREYFPR